MAPGRVSARTESEMVSDTKIFGYEILKVAKYINFFVGIILVAVVFTDFMSLGFTNPFNFTMTLF